MVATENFSNVVGKYFLAMFNTSVATIWSHTKIDMFFFIVYFWNKMQYRQYVRI